MPKKFSLSDQVWVRVGATKYLAFPIEDAEEREGEVCVKWSDRGDVEYVPKEDILGKIISNGSDDQLQQGRRSRRQPGAVVQQQQQHDRKQKSQKESASSQKKTRESTNSKSNKEQATSTTTTNTPYRRRRTASISSKRRRRLPTTNSTPKPSTTSLIQEVHSKVKVVKVVKPTSSEGQDDDISVLTDDRSHVPTKPKNDEYEFKSKKKKGSSWRRKSSTKPTTTSKKKNLPIEPMACPSSNFPAANNDSKKNGISRLVPPASKRREIVKFNSSSSRRDDNKGTSNDPFDFTEFSPASFAKPAEATKSSKWRQSLDNSPHEKLPTEEFTSLRSTLPNSKNKTASYTPMSQKKGSVLQDKSPMLLNRKEEPTILSSSRTDGSSQQNSNKSLNKENIPASIAAPTTASQKKAIAAVNQDESTLEFIDGTKTHNNKATHKEEKFTAKIDNHGVRVSETALNVSPPKVLDGDDGIAPLSTGSFEDNEAVGGSKKKKSREELPSHGKEEKDGKSGTSERSEPLTNPMIASMASTKQAEGERKVFEAVSKEDEESVQIIMDRKETKETPHGFPAEIQKETDFGTLEDARPNSEKIFRDDNNFETLQPVDENKDMMEKQNSEFGIAKMTNKNSLHKASPCITQRASLAPESPAHEKAKDKLSMKPRAGTNSSLDIDENDAGKEKESTSHDSHLETTASSKESINPTNKTAEENPPTQISDLVKKHSIGTFAESPYHNLASPTIAFNNESGGSLEHFHSQVQRAIASTSAKKKVSVAMRSSGKNTAICNIPRKKSIGASSVIQGEKAKKYLGIKKTRQVKHRLGPIRTAPRHKKDLRVLMSVASKASKYATPIETRYQKNQYTPTGSTSAGKRLARSDPSNSSWSKCSARDNKKQKIVPSNQKRSPISSIIEYRNQIPPAPFNKVSVYDLTESIHLENPDMDMADVIDALEDRLGFCLSTPLHRTIEEYISTQLFTQNGTEISSVPLPPSLSEQAAPETTKHLMDNSISPKSLTVSLDKGIPAALQHLQSMWLEDSITNVTIVASAGLSFGRDAMASLFSTVAALPNVQMLSVSIGGLELPVSALMKIFNSGMAIQKLELIDATIFGNEEDYLLATGSSCRLTSLRSLHMVGCAPSHTSSAWCFERWILDMSKAASLETIWLNEVTGVSSKAIQEICKAPTLREIGLRCVPVPQNILVESNSYSKLDIIDCPHSDLSTALLSRSEICKSLRSVFLWGELQEHTAARFLKSTAKSRMESLSLSVTGNVCLHRLGIDRLLNVSTTLERFDLVIVGSLENAEESSVVILRTLSSSLSIKSFRLFTADGEQFASESLKANASKTLITNKNITTLHLFGLEWNRP